MVTKNHLMRLIFICANPFQTTRRRRISDAKNIIIDSKEFKEFRLWHHMFATRSGPKMHTPRPIIIIIIIIMRALGPLTGMIRFASLILVSCFLTTTPPISHDAMMGELRNPPTMEKSLTLRALAPTVKGEDVAVPSRLAPLRPALLAPRPRLP